MIGGQILSTVLVGYFLLTGFMYLTQRNLMYHPVPDMSPPGEYGLALEELELQASDGVNLAAWYAPPRSSQPVIVFFHGNAGHLGYRREQFQSFLDAGFGLMALSFRGFGGSGGSISEEGLYRDGRAAIDHLKGQGIPENRMVLYGESLGSGVATRMATETTARAVVLVSPYISIAERAGEIYWFLPVKWLLKDRFNNLANLPDIEEPLLVIHGEQDRVVPVHHGRTVHARAQEPKALVTFDDRGHNNLEPEAITQAVQDFLASY